MEKRAMKSTINPLSTSNAALQSSSDSRTAQPPPYSSHGSPSSINHDPAFNDSGVIPGLPRLKFNAYRLRDSSVSEDRSTVTTWSTSLNSSLGALLPFIQEQVSLPPKPEIHIVGHHKGSGGVQVEDFRLCLDMMPFLIPQDREVPTTYLQVPDCEPVELASPEAMDILRKGAGTFWGATQRAKCLTINRSIKNWDTEYIEGRIRSLLSELRYRGETTVSFPTVCSTVVVRPARGIADILSIFSTTFTVNIDVVWPFANVARRQASSGVARRCNVCDEQAWWNTWRDTLREAILSKHKGWVGADAWLEVAMGFKPQSKIQRPWGMDV